MDIRHFFKTFLYLTWLVDEHRTYTMNTFTRGRVSKGYKKTKNYKKYLRYTFDFDTFEKTNLYLDSNIF